MSVGIRSDQSLANSPGFVERRMSMTADFKRAFCHIGRVLPLVTCVAGVLAGSCAIAGNAVVNREYGFKAVVPDGLPVCTAESGTHVHGVGTVLSGEDCRNSGDLPAFNIWADYNDLFLVNALDALNSNPVCSGKGPSWGQGEWSHAIAGLRTAMCRVDHSDGRVDIVLLAQAHKWPDSKTEASPYINYTMYFNTTKTRLTTDMKRFKEFVKSVAIVDVGD